MRGEGLLRWPIRGPRAAFSWKSILAWLAIIAVIFGVVTWLRLPERMGCRSVSDRRMICQRSILSPETWGPQTQSRR
jgi:hypothetical protein